MYAAWHSWPRPASLFINVIVCFSAPPYPRELVTNSARNVADVGTWPDPFSAI